MKEKLVIILAALLIFTLASCDEANKQGNPTAQKTAKVTASITTEPTEAPTAAPTKEPLPTAELGLPSDKSEVVYTCSFDQDELDGSILVQSGKYSIKNGKFYLCSTDGGETFGGWDCMTPDVECNPGEVYQWELHMDLQSYYPAETGDAPWMATLVGCRIVNYQSSIADTDDGFWVGFSHRNEVVVYPSGSSTNSEGYWPAGAMTISIPEGFAEMHKVIIVDTGNSIYYYMVTAAGERVLILKADITEDKIIVSDKEGNSKEFTNYLDPAGNHFKVFNHMPACVIDEVTIKSY